MKTFIAALFLFVFYFSFSFAQGEAAVPFLTIQPSAELNGMAGAYTAVPTHSAYGLYYNPAQVGVFAESDNVSMEASKVDWLPAFDFSDLYFKSKVGAFGYNLKNSETEIPLSLGISFMQGYLDLGENVWTDEQGNELGVFHSYEEYSSVSIGLQWDWYVKLAFGMGAKKFQSNLGNISVGVENDEDDGRASGWAFDTGILARLPVFENWPIKMGSIHTAAFFPVLDVNLGLAQLNAGEKIKYIDTDSADPLPLMAKIGFSIIAGFDMQVDERRINLASFTFSSEANDLLVLNDGEENKSYDLFPGEINPYTHVLRAQSDAHVLNRHGYRLHLLETLSLNYGNFSGDHFGDVETAGYRISSRGLSKFFGPTIKHKWLNLFLTHTDLAYNFSQYENEGSSLTGTTFKSISLNIFGF